MLRYLLDTDTVSFALRGVGGVAARMLERRPSEIAISAITLAELRYGAATRRSEKLRHAIETFTRSVTVAPFDAEATVAFAGVATTLCERGVPIGTFDTLVGAHALALGLTLVTHNTGHFSRIEGLEVEDWL